MGLSRVGDPVRAQFVSCLSAETQAGGMQDCWEIGMRRSRPLEQTPALDFCVHLESRVIRGVSRISSSKPTRSLVIMHEETVS